MGHTAPETVYHQLSALTARTFRRRCGGWGFPRPTDLGGDATLLAAIAGALDNVTASSITAENTQPKGAALVTSSAVSLTAHSTDNDTGSPSTTPARQLTHQIQPPHLLVLTTAADVDRGHEFLG